MSENTIDIEPKEWVVANDEGRNLKFKGFELAEVEEEKGAGRHLWLTLYLTSGGNYVCHYLLKSNWQGEHSKNSAALCKTIEEVFNFFGPGRLAKELYSDANLDYLEEVD